jgi:hypothetical protein
MPCDGGCCCIWCGGNCIHRLLQGKAEGAGNSRGKAEKVGKAESREQRGGGCLFGSLSLSLFSIYRW